MKIVGEKLKSLALSEVDEVNKDLFGRSAFNRFYYATFLVTREMLGDLDSKWKHTPHKEIPNLLVTGVRKPVITQLKQNEKKDLIKKGQLKLLQNKLYNATSDLSNLLDEAYDIRIVADYEPENPITINKKVIMLNSCKLTSANTWVDRAKAYCKDIRKVWRDSGLA